MIDHYPRNSPLALTLTPTYPAGSEKRIRAAERDQEVRECNETRRIKENDVNRRRKDLARPSLFVHYNHNVQVENETRERKLRKERERDKEIRK